jgi:TIGR03009 family protein
MGLSDGMKPGVGGRDGRATHGGGLPMRWIVRRLPALIVALAAAAALGLQAQGQSPPARPEAAGTPRPDQAQNLPRPIDPQRLDALLKTWETNSGRLKTLDVRMTRTDRSPAWDEDDQYKGRAMFKTPNLAWLDFEKEKEVKDPRTGAKQKRFMPHERIVCTGTEVWQYRCDTSQIFIYPLEKDVQQRALEEGPLPFLFNFKAADAKKRYTMTLVEDDPQAPVIRIIPRLPIDQESFKLAWVKLDRQLFLLPQRILLIQPDGKSSKDFELKLNPEVANCDVRDENFRPKAGEGWKIVRNPGGDDKTAAAPRTAQQPQPRTPASTSTPAEQPAMRPRLFNGRRN